MAVIRLPRKISPPSAKRGKSSSAVAFWTLTVLLNVACSGGDRAQQLEDPGNGAHLPGTPCATGAERSCGVTLERANGSMTCYRGRQYCEDGSWSECVDGVVTQELDPLAKDSSGSSRFETMSLSPPISCYYDSTCKSLASWSSSSTYSVGEEIRHTGEHYYECLDATLCSGDPTLYEPGAGSDWESAWNRVGSCLNLCDPGCMYFPEDPPDFSTPIGGIPDWGSLPSTSSCSHELCTEGDDLDASCHPCVEKVCTADPSCCTDAGSSSEWDADCVALVYTECETSPPTTTLNMCDFAAYGEVSVRLGNGTTGQPTIGSLGSVTPEPPANLGSIYAKGYVDIRNQNTINGDIVTESSVWFESPSTITGDITAGVNVSIRDGAIVGGSVTATGAIDLASDAQIDGDAWSGTTTNLSSNADILGSVDAYGGITGQAGSRIHQDATVEPPSTISTNVTVDGTQNTSGPVSVPSAPTVELPQVDDYTRDLTASCSQASALPDYNSTADVSLPPGVYGDVTIQSGYTLTLQAGGAYVFNSLRFYANANGVRLAGSPTWDVSVCNSYVTDGGVNVFLQGTSTPPDATDYIVYSAATSGDCISIGDNNTFNGMFLAPDCTIRVYNGSTATASLWGETVYTNSDFDLLNIPVADCEAADKFGAGICDGTTPLYSEDATYANGDQVHHGGQIYECTVAGWCNIGGGYGGGAGYFPGEGLNWADAWDVVGSCPAAPTPGSTGGSCPVDLDLPETPGPREDCYSGQDCQINSRCTEVLTDASCSHNKCVTGSALTATCDPCVARICDVDSACCTDTGGSDWDASCVSLVETVCDATCGTTTSTGCEHDLCSIGSALTNGCDAAADDCVATVCGTSGLGYCCTSTWDQACVDEVYTSCGGTSPPAGPGESVCDYAVMANGAIAAYAATISGGDIGGGTGANNISTDWGIRPNVTGNIYSQGSMSITAGDVTGDVKAPTLSTTWSTISGDTYCSSGCDYPTGTIPSATMPTKTFSCGSGSTTLTTGSFAPGTYGDVTIDGTVQLEAGTYYVNSLTVGTQRTLQLPASGTAIINVCGKILFHWQAEVSGGTSAADALRAQFYSNDSSTSSGTWDDNAIGINGMNSGEPYLIWGTFSAPNGGAYLGQDRTLYGFMHASQVNLRHRSTIDASGATGSDCVIAGLDPSSPICPVTTPTLTTSVTETGLCVENGDTHQVTSSACSAVDLAVDLPCEDTIPVCNHGNTDVPAGEAELWFYPRDGQQFAVESPDPNWKTGSCTITSSIPAGSCVDQACDPTLLSEDLTVMVQLTASASVNECSVLDNWSYYVDGQSCSGGGLSESVYDYEATCPDNGYPSWSALTWDTTVPGGSSVTFEARTSYDGTFTGGYVLLGTAQSTPTDTSTCPITGMSADCPVDITEALWPDGNNNQPPYLELRISLTPSGSDSPTVHDWQLWYTCIEDQ